jgi:hypothetical protein
VKRNGDQESEETGEEVGEKEVSCDHIDRTQGVGRETPPHFSFTHTDILEGGIHGNGKRMRRMRRHQKSAEKNREEIKMTQLPKKGDDILGCLFKGESVEKFFFA